MSNIGITQGVAYNVVGRYMAGSEVLNYHFVGTDGSQLVANKDKTVHMISLGLVENMRKQDNGADVILRGKGVNLLTLPIYDQNKAQFRDNNTSTQLGQSGVVAPRKNSGVSPMGQLRLDVRIMHKGANLGYMVSDMAGKQRKLSRNKVLELADQKLITNAVVQRDGGNIKLRGFNCNLNELPAVEVDEAGNVVKNEVIHEASVRAVKMKQSGTLTDTETGKTKMFTVGDYIICGKHGELHSISSNDLESKFEIKGTVSAAMCDEYLNRIDKYSIKMLGSTAEIKLRPDQVLRWTIVTTTRIENTSKAG